MPSARNSSGGKTLRYLTTGEVREDGTRTVFFELNGQPREVRVVDRSVEGKVKRHPKAEPDNPNHIAAPMPGKISSVAVRAGQTLRTGERLLSIEAMKMETAVYSPRDVTVAEVLVTPGTVVEAGQRMDTTSSSLICRSIAASGLTSVRESSTRSGLIVSQKIIRSDWGRFGPR